MTPSRLDSRYATDRDDDELVPLARQTKRYAFVVITVVYVIQLAVALVLGYAFGAWLGGY